MKTVAAVYTSTILVEKIKELFVDIIPDCRLINIIDDSLIVDVANAGQITGSVARRTLDYYRAAEEAGADIILNTCPSVDQVADIGRRIAKVPIIEINDAMISRAVEMGKTIGIIATLPVTLNTTVRLAFRQAEKIDKDVTIIKSLANNAFQTMLADRPHEYDAMVLKTAKEIAAQIDTIVLAEGAMARLADTLAAETGKPVLASPRLAVEAVRDMLDVALK
jgi:Asp/Glu/hydantoin racemase